LKYIASWSGGKDSTASIILAHEHKEPLDMIIFVEVMFDENISGELPEHIEFVHRAAKVFESWGYPVHILQSDRTYMDCFNHRITRSRTQERVGKKQGFPLSGKCCVNRDCKMRPIRKFWKSVEGEYTQYVGIAVEEKKRLDRLVKNKNTVSILEKYGYTEEMAYQLCKKYDLLSPMYNFAKRGGCWFCPNAREAELRNLWNNHKELFNILLELENDKETVGNIWNRLGKTKIHDWEEIFQMEDRQMRLEI
jgi:3'-phosphoadenosine 5'-phosphosulfate sulfotransferase (PAPS reductase)/FAD synthetase